MPTAFILARRNRTDFALAAPALREKFSIKKIFRPKTGINAHGIYTCKTKSNRFRSFRWSRPKSNKGFWTKKVRYKCQRHLYLQSEIQWISALPRSCRPRPTVCHLSLGGRLICRAAPWCRREMFAHFSAGEGEIGAAAPNGMKIKNGGSKPPPYASRRSHYSSFLIHFSAAPSALREKFSTKKIFRPETGINAHGIYTCKTKSNRFLSFRWSRPKSNKGFWAKKVRYKCQRHLYLQDEIE